MASQLTMEECEIISQMCDAKKSKTVIACRRGRHLSTIGRYVVCGQPHVQRDTGKGKRESKGTQLNSNK